MTTDFYARPQLSHLLFQLYDRPVHPEFFDVLAHRRIVRAGYSLDLWITRTGHVVTWTNRRVCLTEVTAADMTATSSSDSMPRRWMLSEGRRLSAVRSERQGTKS